MLREALDATGIAPNTAASLLGINPETFQAWVADQQPIPYSFKTLLSTVIGINLSKSSKRKVRAAEMADVTPAIWYRFRDKNLVDQDREFVFLVRQLGYFIHELEEATDSKLVGWSSIFQEIRGEVDRQAPPRVQGRQAAKMFRNIRGLRIGATGIGEVIRNNLRSIGIVVIETPLAGSKLEGCCFLVGGPESERPCIFANSHGTTWFRRNTILMHELAHAIFDVESAGASIDFREDHLDKSSIPEERADAFALEMMVPPMVLLHVAQSHGINWDELRSEDLATLVSEIHVEKRPILQAALSSEFISDENHEKYLQLDISKILPKITDHALPAQAYIKKVGAEGDKWINKRGTTIPSRRLRLPPLYVDKIVEAYSAYQISAGKAAEMLMIDKNTFIERFVDGEEMINELFND